uniref:Sulfotransferase domain-containing protein n=1 Tax=viral metagenome TaxID=1070528 RepID=A0A6C0HU54_9ZZZZ
MPYFNDIIFIHIPKTGGTSVEKYFSKKFNIPLNFKSLYGIKGDYSSSLQHLTYLDLVKHKLVDFTDKKIITIVRNPYERIVSDLFWYRKIKKNTSSEDVCKIIKKYLMEKKLDNHNIPQHLFIKGASPIHIMRTETLKKDMNDLGYDFDINVHKNKENVDYYSFLNKESIALINDFYNTDFELFNYTKIDV